MGTFLKKFEILLILVLFQIPIFSQIDTLSIYFEIGKSNITKKQQNEILDFITSNFEEKFDLEIQGFADSIGQTKKNKELSQVRSKNIEAFIKFQFEDKVNTIHAIGLGESNLKDFEKNRRADLIFKKLDYSMEAKMKNKLEGQTLILEGLNFHPGQAKLIPEAIPEAYKLFLFLANNPLVKIEIHGHVWGQYQSENESKRKQALDLSEERAKNIYDYLIFKGIDKNRLSFKGFGFDHPLEDPLAGMKNRRVEILILKK